MVMPVCPGLSGADCNLVRDIVFSEYIPFDHAGLSDLADVSDTGRHNGIAVICLAVLREEAD